jgi:peptidoglycan hydrolase CwlO-like protein
MNELKHLHKKEVEDLKAGAESRLSEKQFEVQELQTRIEQLQKDGESVRILLEKQEAELRAEIKELKVRDSRW